MENLPKLTERQIRSRCGDRSYGLGIQYYDKGAIIEPRVEGNTLKARCRGSQGGPYRVWAKLGSKGIESADCSCAVGDGGCCKHTAALLLTWLRKPEKFSEAESLDKNLANRSKDELIALVKQMLRRQPDLEPLLSMPLPGSTSKGQARPSTFRKQAVAVFDDMSGKWGELDGVVDQLEAITEIGDTFLKQKDVESAAAAFEGVGSAIAEAYESVEDHDGDLAALLQSCCENLGKCLEQIADPKVRKRILRFLFDVYQLDADAGGIGVSDDAFAVLNDLKDDERKQLIEWVEEVVQESAGSRWNAQWLLALRKDDLDDHTALELCRKHELREELIERLLKLGRGQEAAAEAARLEEYSLLRMEADFKRHGQSEAFDAIMMERARKSPHPGVLAWLRKRAKQNGDSAAMLQLSQREFAASPSKESYEAIQVLAVKLGKWESVRVELLKQLKGSHRTDLLARICLEEGRIDEALKLVKGNNSFGWPSADLEVAKAVERVRPRAAIEIYCKQIDLHMASRGREGYREAAKLLKRLRRTHENAGEPECFSKYMENLRQKYGKLRTFWDEVQAAEVLADSGAV
jgi:uncharacterized Zn finger protein